MKSYLKFLTEQKKDTAVFTFGRFNPPTVGHEKLITATETAAKSAGGDYFVYPSHTQDTKKNPLTQAQKIKYMKLMFTRHKSNIIKTKGKDPFKIASEIYKKKYSNLIMVVGSDRVKEFKTLLLKYNGKDGKHGFYDFKNIKVMSAGERDPDAEGAEGMSASKMRKAAVEGDFQSFRIGTPSTLDDANTKKMFNDTRKGMKLDVIKEGKKWKEIDFSYTIPEPIIASELNFKDYETENFHTSPEAFDAFDEMINSMDGHNNRNEFYILEALKTTDQYLKLRRNAVKNEVINTEEFNQFQKLVKKKQRLIEDIDLPHIDHSYSYKYINELTTIVI